MQSLILERATGRLRPLDFARTVTESLYSVLEPVEGVFPENCFKNAAVNSLALDPANRYLLSGCADSSVKIWDTEDSGSGEDDTESSGTASEAHNSTDLPQPVLQLDEGPAPQSPAKLTPLISIPRRAAHQFGVSTVKWWPRDAGLFLTASFDHTVKVWDTNAVEVVHSFDMTSRVYAIDVAAHESNQFSAHALIAVASDQPFVRLLDLRSSASTQNLSGHKNKTLTVAWHPQNPFLLASGGFDGETKVWDIRRSNSCVARLDMTKTNARAPSIDLMNLGLTSVKAHLGPVNGLVWDETGQTLFTAGHDDRIRVWDMSLSNAPPINKLVNFGPLTRNKYLQTLPLVLSPREESDTPHLLFASDSGDVLVFRALDGKLKTRLLRRGSNKARTVSLVCAGPFTSRYYCGTLDGQILVWTGQPSPAPNVPFPSDLPLDVITTTNVSRDGLYDDPFFKFDLK